MRARASPRWAAPSGLSAPAVGERLARLEEAGVIRGYHAEIDPGALGLTLSVVLRIRPAPREIHKVAELAQRTPEVTECVRVTGEDCFVMRAHVRDVHAPRGADRPLRDLRADDDLDRPVRAGPRPRLACTSNSLHRVPLPDPFHWQGDHVAGALPGGRVLFSTRRGGVSDRPVRLAQPRPAHGRRRRERRRQPRPARRRRRAPARRASSTASRSTARACGARPGRWARHAEEDGQATRAARARRARLRRRLPARSC